MRTTRFNGKKIYVHGLFNPWPAQDAAYPGQGLLGWAYPSRGLPWTWKCSYKCTQMLSAAWLAETLCWSLCWSRERMLRMLYFQLYPRPLTLDLHGRETHTAVAGKWPAAQELHKRAGKFRLNPTSSIAETSLSNHSIDHWRTLRRGFRKSIATTPHSNLDRSVNLKRKR